MLSPVELALVKAAGDRRRALLEAADVEVGVIAGIVAGARQRPGGHGAISEAADAAGVARTTIYRRLLAATPIDSTAPAPAPADPDEDA